MCLLAPSGVRVHSHQLLPASLWCPETISSFLVYHDGKAQLADGSGGVLIRELCRWRGPSLLSVQPSGETFSGGFNSRLTSLSASGVRRQTCKTWVQQQWLENKSLIHYNTAADQPPFCHIDFLFPKLKTYLTMHPFCILVSLNTFCCKLVLYIIWQSHYGRSMRHMRKSCTFSLPLIT